MLGFLAELVMNGPAQPNPRSQPPRTRLPIPQVTTERGCANASTAAIVGIGRTLVTMFIDGFVHSLPDIDPAETTEWLDSLDAVVDGRGRARARYLLARLMERAREQGVGVPAMVTTDYINTIPPEHEPWFPGDELLEKRIRAYIRWNAMAMVDRANHRFEGLGGHLSTFASAAALYDVGFNHFFHGKADGGFGDQVFLQGHAAP